MTGLGSCVVEGSRSASAFDSVVSGDPCPAPSSSARAASCWIRFRFSEFTATVVSPAGSDCERVLSHLRPSISQLDSVPASDGGRGLKTLTKFS